MALLLSLTGLTLPFTQVAYEVPKDIGISEINLKVTSKAPTSRCLQHWQAV